jgi:hypothetical protein
MSQIEEQKMSVEMRSYRNTMSVCFMFDSFTFDEEQARLLIERRRMATILVDFAL